MTAEGNVFRVANLILSCLLSMALLANGVEQTKPKVAFFPLGGDAKGELRERCGLSLRLKLDRTGLYDVIDGPKMAEVAGEAKEAIGFATSAEAIRELGNLVDAQVLVWGELVNSGEGATMRLKVLDLREKDGAPRPISRVIKQPTDLRFVSEEVLQMLPGVATFEHPSEEAVTGDAESERAWKANPNLVKNGDFASAGQWKGIYQSEYYDVAVSGGLPGEDKVAIVPLAEGGAKNRVLAMRLSKTCAENNGLAALSEKIEIKSGRRYRLSFRYKSDGPRLHVFVKGYTPEKDIKGDKAEREIYRRQVPPTGATGGQWRTVVCDLNPQHVAFPVMWLRVDLYAYLSPGVVMFDDVVVKEVGGQTRKAMDEAIKRPVRK